MAGGNRLTLIGCDHVRANIPDLLVKSQDSTTLVVELIVVLVPNALLPFSPCSQDSLERPW